MSSTGQPRLGATDLLQALPDPKEILLQGTGELVFLLNSYFIRILSDIYRNDILNE
jgi:hypothetical protein